MRSIADDFDLWSRLEPQTFPRFDLLAVSPDDVWDDVPTAEWAHPLDLEPCNLCPGGRCSYLTQEMVESAEWIEAPELGGES